MKTEEISVINCINNLSKRAYHNAVVHGFWDKEREDGTSIALIHSELSECLEAARNGNPLSEKKLLNESGVTCVEEELADTLVRIFDMAGKAGMNLGRALVLKMTYNEGRPHKHGKVF